MITEEIFQYLYKIGALSEKPISFYDFKPIRHLISMADASNYALEDSHSNKFHNYIDELIKRKYIHTVFFVMQELYTQSAYGETDIQLYEMSKDAYMEYILFKTNLPENLLEKKVVYELNKHFKAECFPNFEFGEGIWCITWD